MRFSATVTVPDDHPMFSAAGNLLFGTSLDEPPDVTTTVREWVNLCTFYTLHPSGVSIHVDEQLDEETT